MHAHKLMHVVKRIHAAKHANTAKIGIQRLIHLITLTSLLVGLAGCLAVTPQTSDSERHPFRPPSVKSQSDERGFWRHQVHYAFPEKYYTVKDDRNQLWEIAVTDSHAITPVAENTPTLVLIHGRGANSGYFYQLTRQMLDAGFRVVTVDLPGDGKSQPGNLQNAVPLPLADSRKLVHNVLVEQMNIPKATYLGHSLGAQWVLGYALKFPRNVEKLILESPYGLEEYAPSVKVNESETLALFDPLIKYDYEQWQNRWSVLGYFDREFRKTAEDIRLFNYFQKLNAKTGAIEPASVGYFQTHSIDSTFLTRVRTELIWAPADEFERYLRKSEWDIYGQGIEVLRNDPQSLPKQLEYVQAPVLMVFGGQDPFLPNTAFSGNRHLREQVIKPAFIRLASSGYLPKVVIYPGAGHIPHADQATAFSKDVIRFVQFGDVDSAEEDPLGYAN